MKEFAPAKINLALHVVGQRDDGYHLLESLVGFTEFGDRISGKLSDENHFDITGPYADLMVHEDHSDNLIIRARNLLVSFAEQRGQTVQPVHLSLDKHIPIAAGIGGGSADAGAALRLLRSLWCLEISDQELHTIAIKLGADVPACLISQPQAMLGIGDILKPLHHLPDIPILLVNPNKSVATPKVFEKLGQKNNPSVPFDSCYATIDAVINMFHSTRNDLEAPAQYILPEIAECLALLRQTNAPAVRMSGSGATCFALYEKMDMALLAQKAVQQAQPDWFATATYLRGVHVNHR